MLKHITSNSKYLSVSHNSSDSYIYPNGAQGAGNIRFNLATQTIEICDGTYWKQIYTSSSINMSNEAEELLDWAKEKRNEELRLKELAKSNPTIDSLLKDRDKIDEQINLVKILCG